MSKLSYKANARTKIGENLVFLPIISSLFTLSLVILLAGVAWADQKITKSHGFNFFGELSYQEDFAHLKYVNKDAPKGGDISIWSMGTFDSMNPYTRKGRSGALASAPFESYWMALLTRLVRFMGCLLTVSNIRKINLG